MYLKKIQLQGFKSFPNKTVVEFKDGITGIVGPNGSGKSNISDAIRWALGEQSTKMLRGNRMEDVIFAGSESRRPLGYAEVILIFDNTDNKIDLEYSEVAIKRRVFRSGESEYYINNTSCRLKDIRDLFMDTGIGKDGYSIIGQGKIDEILSNKPEERRHIFEEAAGIIKYKTRKEEAERKLKRTDENILRVEDILGELRSRVGSLEKESRKAKDYKDISSQLNKMELELLIRKLSKLEVKLEDLNKEKLARLEEEKNLDKKIESLEASILEKEKYLAKIDQDLSEIDSIYNKNNEELLDYNNKKTVLQESKRYAGLENERYKKEIELNKKEIAKNKEKRTKQEAENKSLSLELEKHRKLYEEEEKQLEASLKALIVEEEKIEEEKDRMLSFYNNITDKKGELANLTNFKKTIVSQSEDIREELKSISGEKSSIETRLKDIEKSIFEKEELKTTNESKRKSLREKLDSLGEENSSLKSKLEDNRLALNMNKSQYNMNINMQENYEGYYRSVKALMVNSRKDKKLESNIVGVVADLIEVEDAYTKAIDIALGSSMQNIVTPDEEAAKELIAYLKDNKLGRATFLPVNIIKGRKLDLKDIDFKEYGVIGIASDIVKYSEEYRNIMENLLGRVVVTKDLDSSIKLARRLKHSTRIVSLEGDLINPGGSMTGGSIYSKSSNILSRKNTIRELEVEEKKLRLAKEKYETSLEGKLLEYSRVEKDLSTLDEALRTSSLTIDRLKNEKVSIKLEYEKIIERLKKLEKDHSYFSGENKAMEEKRLSLEKEIDLMEEKKEKLQEDLNDLMIRFKSNKDKKEELSNRITEHRIRVGSLEEEYKYREERFKHLKEENIGLKKSIEEKEVLIKSNEDNLKKISLDLEKLKESIEEIELKNKELQSEKEKIKRVGQVINEELKTLKKEDLSLFKDRELLREKLNRLELDLTKYMVHYENYKLEIEEGYNIDYREDLNESYPELSYEELESIIKKHSRELEKLGIVNLASIEEYENVKERLDFMNGQINDLNKAKKDLFKIIREMEDKMKLKFSSSFKEIKANFNEVFMALFNGGKADIILEDEKDILNCGIEIKAQPPGKKFQSLSLLSGGERSLTAVALLFSILEMKPAPFCILDEIDAALDESNIDRYTSYLRRFSGETQFIMITHRKRTMEIADTIYGVTMEEEGVSKTVSIELSDLDNNREG